MPLTRALLSATLFLATLASGEPPRPTSEPGNEPGILHQMQSPNAPGPTAADARRPARGADVGWLSEMEAAGKVFRSRDGKQDDLLKILKETGVDAIRLRLWVNPADGWCGKQDLLRQATRANRMGFRLMIDFHYSDSWADPGQQNKPAAWASHGLEQLKTDVHDHTVAILKALGDSGVVPEWVQVGNETNDGMLWPDGRASTNMAGYAALISAGARAVREASPTSKVVVHLANGWDNALFRWSFDGLKKNNVDWDVIGMSLYPEPSAWRPLQQQTLANMKDMVTRYGKDVVLSEVGMDWMAADSTKALLQTLQKDMESMGPRNLGIFYWEPQCHYGWKGYFKGAFDDNGRPTLALTAFQGAVVGASPRPRQRLPPVSSLPHDALGRSSDAPSLMEPRFR